MGKDPNLKNQLQHHLIKLFFFFFYRIILPLMQSYTQAGDFTVRGKLKSALVDNAIYYGSFLFIAAILLIYLAVKPHMQLDWFVLLNYISLILLYYNFIPNYFFYFLPQKKAKT